MTYSPIQQPRDLISAFTTAVWKSNASIMDTVYLYYLIDRLNFQYEFDHMDTNQWGF